LELDFIPQIVAQAWRVLVFLASSGLAGRIIFDLIGRETPIGVLSPERRWAWFGVMVYLVQNVMVMIYRFGDEIVIYGAPMSTIGLTIFWIAYWSLQRELNSTDDGNAARRPRNSAT